MFSLQFLKDTIVTVFSIEEVFPVNFWITVLRKFPANESSYLTERVVFVFGDNFNFLSLKNFMFLSLILESAFFGVQLFFFKITTRKFISFFIIVFLKIHQKSYQCFAFLRVFKYFV